MKNRISKLITDLNDIILAIVLVSVISFSVIIVESIKLKPSADENVLGANSIDTMFISTINSTNKQYQVNYTENDFQVSFNMTFNFNGKESINIPLGTINTMAIKQGGKYRSIINLPDVYKDDINILLIINGKSFGLLLNGVYYQNSFLSYSEEDAEISLIINPRKEIYYKIPADFIIYK